MACSGPPPVRPEEPAFVGDAELVHVRPQDRDQPGRDGHRADLVVAAAHEAAALFDPAVVGPLATGVGLRRGRDQPTPALRRSQLDSSSAAASDGRIPAKYRHAKTPPSFLPAVLALRAQGGQERAICSGFATTRRSTLADTSGAFHCTLSIGLAARIAAVEVGAVAQREVKPGGRRAG